MIVKHLHYLIYNKSTQLENCYVFYLLYHINTAWNCGQYNNKIFECFRFWVRLRQMVLRGSNAEWIMDLEMMTCHMESEFYIGAGSEKLMDCNCYLRSTSFSCYWFTQKYIFFELTSVSWVSIQTMNIILRIKWHNFYLEEVYFSPRIKASTCMNKASTIIVLMRNTSQWFPSLWALVCDHNA